MSAAKTSSPKPAKPAAKKTLPETAEGLPWVSTQEIKKETNPFTERDWRMLVYAWMGMAVRVVVVFGALFTVYQFLTAQEQSRVQRAFEMVEMWERPEYQAAQRAVRSRIETLNSRYATILGDQPTSNARAVVMRKIGQEAMTAEGGSLPVAQFREEFDRVVYILNRVAFCVESKLCSREVADAYFGDYAHSFWNYFAGYVEGQRKTVSPTYARPIENYVLSVPTPAAP